MHELRKNVPIPKTVRPNMPSRRKYPFHEMEIDDMFFVPGRTKNTLSTHATTVGKALNRKYVTRKTYMVKTKQGWEPCDPGATGATLGIGVWRTE